MNNMEINFLALILAGMAGIAIGAIWFGPKTFFPIWWKFLGKDSDQPVGSNKMGLIFGGTFIAAFVQALVMSVVINHAEASSGEIGTLGGLAVGSLMGVGFSAASSLSHQLFAGLSIRAWVLEVGQDIVSLAAMGAIIASF
jgi:hypothetical protein